MNFNWDGDIIIHDCAVDKKRYVIGSKRPITTDIREFVSPADDTVIKGILSELVENGMPSSRNPGDFDRRALAIWNHVARNVRYKFDAKAQRKDDFWLFPSEVHTLAYGDCEDGSFLLASLLIGSGISSFNVRVVLGELYDDKGHSLGGHCWPMYKSEAGQWCILESTFDRAAWSLPAADRFTGSGHSRYLPHFCFNNVHLWAIRHTAKQEVDVQRYLKEKSKRGALANLNNTKFPSGGFLSTIAGDTSPGHLELTRSALNNEKFAFSEDAVAIVSDAAQDPDFYEWYNPAAHAQTDCDMKTGATRNAADGITDYVDWCLKQKKKFIEASTKEEALFFLGYLLHGVQDLASHQGLTNAQHAYQSYIESKGSDDCDHQEANRQLASTYSSALLERLARQKPQFFRQMKKYTTGFAPFGARVAKLEKCRFLGKEDWDLTMDAFIEYKGLAKKYQQVQAANPLVIWDRQEVFEQLLAGIQH